MSRDQMTVRSHADQQLERHLNAPRPSTIFLGTRASTTQTPPALLSLIQQNGATATDFLLGRLARARIPALDGMRAQGPGCTAYLSHRRQLYGSETTELEPDEAVADRFWIVHTGPTDEVCPPPKVRASGINNTPVATTAAGRVIPSNGQHEYRLTLDYPYVALVVRTPVLDISLLDHVHDDMFDGLSDDDTAWTGRPAGTGCSWHEIHRVLGILNGLCLSNPERRIRLMAAPVDGTDPGTNTSMRVLLCVGASMRSEEAAMLQHGDLSMTDIKKTALFLWFFERHLRRLCDPRQSVVRPPAAIFGDWGRYGPLARSLCQFSEAARRGLAQQHVMQDGHQLNAVLQYAPRTFFDRMTEYKKMAAVWNADVPGVLSEVLLLGGQFGAGVRGAMAGVAETPAHALQLGVLEGVDTGHQHVMRPVVSFGGFQCIPFDMFLVRAAARLAQRCLQSAAMPRLEFQALLTRLEQASVDELPAVLELLDQDVAQWQQFMRYYVHRPPQGPLQGPPQDGESSTATGSAK